MKALNLIVAMLLLGVIAYSSKANATALPRSTQLISESRLELAQANLKDAEKYWNSGNEYLLRDDYKGAIADFTKAIEINPEFTQAYLNRGVAYAFLQDYQAAIADYTKAIEINPKLAPAYDNRGVVRGELAQSFKYLFNLL